MKKMSYVFLLLMLPVTVTVAQDVHHDHHLSHATSQESVNDAAPEGALAPTGPEISQAQRCKLAIRGVVMIDNAEWAACGGKPASAPPGLQDLHHQHGDH